VSDKFRIFWNEFPVEVSVELIIFHETSKYLEIIVLLWMPQEYLVPTC
jgi:hypothetical protein